MQEFVGIPNCLNHLAEQRRWVGWRWEERERKKPTKPPRTVRGGRVNGYARNDDPVTWATLAEAEAARAAGEVEGIGLQLLGLEGFAALDLDDVRDPETGAVLPWAEELIACGSYAEATPSGTGFRVIGRVAKEHPSMHQKKKHPDGGAVEFYSNINTGRYITVSGARVDVAPDALIELDGTIAKLWTTVNSPEDAGGDPGDGFDFDRRRFEDLPEWLRTSISRGRSGDRSADFQGAVNALRPRGWTFEETIKLFEQHPSGPAGKFAGRLEQELRRSWEKAEDSSSGSQGQKSEKNKKPAIAILSSSRFLSTWAPQCFLWKGIIEEGRLLTMCGPTGTGKTAIGLLMALAIARGQELAGRRTRQAGVLFLAGENPTDVKTRWKTALGREMIDPDTVDVHFVEGRFNIEEQLDAIHAHLTTHPTGLVIPDTLQAFFDGDDSNSNDQMKAAAFGFREITKAGPAVLIPAHPKKGASRDNNVPYGGGALLNEVDGNISLWGSQACVELHWCGKFRGSFDPVHFALDVCQMPDVLDLDGDPITTVIARAIGGDEAETQEEVLNGELICLLAAIRDNPGASIERLGTACAPMAGLPGWSRSNTDRRLKALIARGLIEKSLGKVVLTAKGGRFLGDS
jgi:hypothetical protein